MFKDKEQSTTIIKLLALRDYIEVINYFTLTLLNLTTILYLLNPLTTYLAYYLLPLTTYLAYR